MALSPTFTVARVSLASQTHFSGSGSGLASFPGLPRFLFFGLRSAASIYCTERKPKNKKRLGGRGVAGNEARSGLRDQARVTSLSLFQNSEIFIPKLRAGWSPCSEPDYSPPSRTIDRRLRSLLCIPHLNVSCYTRVWIPLFAPRHAGAES